MVGHIWSVGLWCAGVCRLCYYLWGREWVTRGGVGLCHTRHQQLGRLEHGLVLCLGLACGCVVLDEVRCRCHRLAVEVTACLPAWPFHTKTHSAHLMTPTLHLSRICLPCTRLPSDLRHHTTTHHTMPQVINFWTGEQQYDEQGQPEGEPNQPTIEQARAEFPDCIFMGSQA